MRPFTTNQEIAEFVKTSEPCGSFTILGQFSGAPPMPILIAVRKIAVSQDMTPEELQEQLQSATQAVNNEVESEGPSLRSALEAMALHAHRHNRHIVN